jgi:hypothetical protein
MKASPSVWSRSTPKGPLSLLKQVKLKFLGEAGMSWMEHNWSGQNSWILPFTSNTTWIYRFAL